MRYISIALTYLVWLPCALLKDIAKIFFVPFDINRFAQTYVNIRITKHNIENSIAQIDESDEPEDEPGGLYKDTKIGYTSSTSNEG